MGIVDPDVFWVMVLVVRNLLEAIFAFLLQALNVKHFILGEEVASIPRELPDRYMYQ